ncbi:MAG: cation:proton antiporter [Dysgonamonadaceae bacterium]|jgi:Kef-type K+ transport system membrane component KefB/nucleotide-binding universal stress UspA family protein|nr:cation:proton antiporter [Dysgonamonadaceae bacterium]
MMNHYLTDLLREFSIPFGNPVLIFVVLLSIVLIVPILLRRINVPGIIGLIVAGVIIGPHGFNLVDNTNAGVELFSTIGLLYIMFIVGLELDLQEFLENKNKSLIFGIFTFIFPFVLSYPICRYFLEYSHLTSLIIADMLAAHTLVTYPIISRLGVSKNQAVAVTIGGTILVDTIVLVFFALAQSNNQGSIEFSYLLKLVVSLAVFAFIVFFVVPRVAKWFFQKAESEKYATFVFTLLIVFLCGFLADLSGIEPIIGAFAAGLALNQLIPPSSALMNRIEFFGNALFVPVFLISVGMLVDISVVFSDSRTIIVALSITFAALFGKWLAAFFTQKIFRYSAAQRNLIFGLSGSRAAATIAIIIVAYKEHLVGEHVLNGTIILILITCIVASFATQRSAKKIAISEENALLTSSAMKQFTQEKILVPIANPSNIGHHVELALLIKDKKSKNSISLLGVMPNNKEAEQNIIGFRKKLQEFVKTAMAADVQVEIIATIDHNPAGGIIRIARETMSDIVILGWPGKVGMIERLLGETVDSIIKNMDKNLFVCHIEQSLNTHKRIVVISPPLAEKEGGFGLWVDKISKMSQELSLPVLHIGNLETNKAIAKRRKSGIPFAFESFKDWGNPLMCSKLIKKDDIIVLISAHAGYVSHISILDHLPTRLERLFPDYSRIVIYPKQHTPDALLESDDYLFIT